MTSVYKICSAAMWREAEAAGSFAGAPVDLADGYVHLSTAGQVRATAARHFAGQHGLVLVTVDAAALGPALRFEPSRGGDLFPHLYGTLPLSAVRSVDELPLGPDGSHLFPQALVEAEVQGFDPGTAGWIRAEADNFIGLVGPVWVRADGDRSRFGLLAEHRHLNRGGIVHGGMIMTFADQALGMAAWAVNGARPQVTIQLDTHFVAAVREGEFVEARCRVVRQTRSLLFLSAELAVGARIVATSAGVWKMRDG